VGEPQQQSRCRDDRRCSAVFQADMKKNRINSGPRPGPGSLLVAAVACSRT